MLVSGEQGRRAVAFGSLPNAFCDCDHARYAVRGKLPQTTGAPQNKTRPRVALESIVHLTTDPVQITFGGSRNGCFCICKNIRLPPAAVNLLE
jgi:hypothetical protein